VANATTTPEINTFIADIGKWKQRAAAGGAHGLLENINHHERDLMRLQSEQSKPARLCLTGRFSSGKTTVAGVLLGACGKLPAAENPTTGNIVEFTLHRAGADLQETRLRDWRVRIVDRETAEQILAGLLRNGAALVERYGMGDREQLRRAQDRRSPTHWIDAVNWAIAIRQSEHNRELRAVAFEIYRFAKVFEQLLTHAGKVFSVSEEQARRLMTLDFDPKLVFECELHTLPTLSPKGRELAFDSMTEGDLRAVFPAICKILIDVDLPEAVANLISPDPQMNFQIVDCAGFNADGSSIRDSTICSVELRNVDAVLAVIDGRIPGDNLDWIGEFTRTWGLDARSRVLTAVNRFDQLPLHLELPRLTALAASEEPLRLEELRKVCASTVFVLLEAAGQTLLDGDLSRAVLMSSMACIDHQLSAGLRLGTTEFLSQTIESGDRDWRARCELWGKIGERLRKGATTDAERTVAKLLLDFSQDGGGNRLRNSLVSHIRGKGGVDRSGRLEKEWKQFRITHAELQEMVENIGVAAADVSDLPLADAAERVARAYDVVRDAVKKMPPDLQARQPGRSTPVKVIPLLEVEAIGKVSDWDCWCDTLHVIEPTREPSMIPVIGEGDLASGWRKLQVPLRSDDFEAPFLATCDQLISMIRALLPKLIEHAVAEVNSRIEQQLGESRDELLKVLQAATADDNMRKLLGTAFPEFSRSVRLCCGDLDLNREIETELQTVLDKCASQADAGYPVQRTRDGSHAVVYPWNERIFNQYRLTFETRHRHVMRIYRLRHTLTDAVLFFLKNCVHELQSRLHKTVDDRLVFIQHTLKATAQTSSVLNKPAGPSDLLSNLLDPA
jgi:hypothetical protein